MKWIVWRQTSPKAIDTFYRADEWQQIFHNGDALAVPGVLSGSSVPLLRLFE